jgi:LmbE family N-acetylglucosaminyl deacetylase
VIKLYTKSVAVIVAHPDEETLWAGGTILGNPSWQWFIVCLSRRSDEEIFTRFYNALRIYKSEGIMGNLEDGSEQKPLDGKVVEQAIMDLLPKKHFDLILTHNPSIKHKRHIRQEEVSKGVINLWHKGLISTDELWTFAYEDGNKEYCPRPIKTASHYNLINKYNWQKKYGIITETYGFKKNSIEAETSPRAETFWQFNNPHDAQKWLDNGGI